MSPYVKVQVRKNTDFLLIVLLVLYINHALLIQYVAQKYGKYYLGNI